jgi:glycosyltransferase involved in cell wall biosynthesis
MTYPAMSDQTVIPESGGRNPSNLGSAMALVIVRNTGTHDSRVLREARTLSSLGYTPEVLAVVSDDEPRTEATIEGIPFTRLSPGSPFSWLRSRLRRSREVESSQPSGGDSLQSDATAPGGGRSRRSVLVRMHRWLRTLDYYRRAIAVVRAERPVLIHCNDYNTMWVGVAARLMGGTAVVYDAHELWPDRNLRPEPRWWLLACEWLFVRLANRTITASPGYADVISRRYHVARPQVIRNIPELPEQPQLSGDPAEDGDSGFVYVGALTRNRGIEVSIRAIARAPGARLRLLGPVGAAYSAELERLAEQEGVSDRVEVAAAVPPGGVIEALRGATAGLALIQPACLSYELSLPNKLFEYLLAGVPVLASDLPVLGGFVTEHRVGLVADPDDPDDVAAKLVELMRPDRNRELRAAVVETAKELRWDRESQLLGATYTEALAAVRGG